MNTDVSIASKETRSAIFLVGAFCIGLLSTVVFVRYLQFAAPTLAYVFWIPVAIWLYGPFALLAKCAGTCKERTHLPLYVAAACLYAGCDTFGTWLVVGERADALGGLLLLALPVFQLTTTAVLYVVLRSIR